MSESKTRRRKPQVRLPKSCDRDSAYSNAARTTQNREQPQRKTHMREGGRSRVAERRVALPFVR